MPNPQAEIESLAATAATRIDQTTISDLGRKIQDAEDDRDKFDEELAALFLIYRGSRTDTIQTTEGTNSREAGKDNAVKYVVLSKRIQLEKWWIHPHPGIKHGPNCFCDEYYQQGWVKMDRYSAHPPNHPNCVCWMEYREAQ